jgi:RNA polymerase sigma-70 factor (ECF subfamily)
LKVFFNRRGARHDSVGVKREHSAGSGVSHPDANADEAALVAACRAGDARALEQFFSLLMPRVERVLGRLVGATPDLEDMVQSTFVEAMSGLGRFLGEASLATWVTRIAVHVAYRHLRQGVRRHVPLELLPPAEEPRVEGRPLEEALADRQAAQRLHSLLDRIKPKKRLAFLLYTVEGYSIEEVAALMRASRAATKSRIWFARRELLRRVRHDPFFQGSA